MRRHRKPPLPFRRSTRRSHNSEDHFKRPTKMLRRLLQILAVLIGLIVCAALLGPFLISAKPVAVDGSALSAAGEAGSYARIGFPGTTGIDLHYRDLGPTRSESPSTYVLLHGFTFNLHTWDRVIDRFAAEGRVVAYDQIPYGLSAKLTRADWSGPNPYAKEAAVARLFSLLDTLGIEQATLVGSSSGGTLAIEAALAEPQRVDGLILVAPWVYAQRPTLPAWLAELPQLRRLSLFIGRRLGEGVLLDYSYADPARVTASRRSRMAVHTGVPGWDLAWGELLSRSLYSPVEVSGRLGKLTLPVLLITGDRDKLVPAADTERVARNLPNATLRILPDCGHVPQEECPEAFWKAVSGWMAVEGDPGKEVGAGRAGGRSPALLRTTDTGFL
jgi:pimeloyl-ACP methyl ester carboxylesterase